MFQTLAEHVLHAACISRRPNSGGLALMLYRCRRADGHSGAPCNDSPLDRAMLKAQKLRILFGLEGLGGRQTILQYILQWSEYVPVNGRNMQSHSVGPTEVSALAEGACTEFYICLSLSLGLSGGKLLPTENFSHAAASVTKTKFESVTTRGPSLFLCCVPAGGLIAVVPCSDRVTQTLSGCHVFLHIHTTTRQETPH